MGWSRHLNDDRLFECYLGERGIEPVNFAATEHLDDCRQCRDRYTNLTRRMDDLRLQADADLDAIFTPRRLDAQRRSIAERLASLTSAARVLTFPSQSVSAAPSVTRIGTRWLAAAAAAGLFVGVGVGIFFDAKARGLSAPIAAAAPAVVTPAPAADRTLKPPQPAAKPAPAETVAVPVSVPDTSDEDSAFMSDLQVAFDRPGTRELLALDAVTPRVRDASFAPR